MKPHGDVWRDPLADKEPQTDELGSTRARKARTAENVEARRSAATIFNVRPAKQEPGGPLTPGGLWYGVLILHPCVVVV